MPSEGFWHNTCEPDDGLPIPTASEKSWKNQNLFLKALILVEEKLLRVHQINVDFYNNHGGPIIAENVICYRGFSSCRICETLNCSREFSMNGWQWPEGFRHYIEKHNVKPSGEFITFILNKSQAELSSKQGECKHENSMDCNP